MPFTPGENIGPYTLIEQLGQGGMATVYKAYHAALDRDVAIKVLHPSFKGDANFAARFTREARIVAKLLHPNIVPVYDFAEHEGRSYLVMRYIEGGTLKARLEKGPLEMAEIRRILGAVSGALTYAHGQGVLHRDVKPSNVMLADDGAVFLADFGLARIAASGESTLSQDMMVGTPNYISPEQAKGESNLDARTDIYSLGVVLFQMLTGRVPFSADTPYAVIHDHIFTPLPLPTSINPQISPALERVLLKALAKEKEDRFASVAEMMVSFEKASVAGKAAQPEISLPEPVPPVPVPAAKDAAPVTVGESEPPQPPVEKKRRWPWVAAAILLFFACICCALFVMNAQQQKKEGTVAAAETEPETGIDKPATPAGAPAEELLNQGDELVIQGQFDEALKAYQQAVELDPDFIPAYLHGGDLLARQENFEAAAEVYQKAADLAPEDAEIHIKLALVLSRLGQWPEAGDHYQRAVELKPNSALAHAGLARYHITLGNLREARQEIDAALELDPNLPEAHLVLGIAYRVGGQRDKAALEFQFVLESPNASVIIKLEAEKQIELLQTGSD